MGDTPQKPDHTPRWQRFTVIVVSVVALLAGNVGYTTWVDHKRDRSERESDRRWCELLVELDTAYEHAPPSSTTGHSIAQRIHELRVGLNC